MEIVTEIQNGLCNNHVTAAKNSSGRFILQRQWMFQQNDIQAHKPLCHPSASI